MAAKYRTGMSSGASGRLESLDALRGFDMLFIMGLAELIVSVCSMFPEGADCFLARNMEHVDWNGIRIMDTVFPTFLFIAGISFPYSLAKQKEQRKSNSAIILKIITRAIALILLGLIYNGLLRFDFQNLRCASVLARIGIAWMFAALFQLFFSRKTRVTIAISILVLYWLAMMFVPQGGSIPEEPFSFDGNLVGFIDRIILPGKMYEGTFDPEGLFSTIPAIVTAMLGMMTGEYVRSSDHSGGRKTLYMILASVAMLAIGLLWSTVFPINKKLWTSTFVLVAAAYALLLFSVFYFIIDVLGIRGWAMPLKVVGMNSITIYMAQSIINFNGISRFFFGGFARMFPDGWSECIMNAAYMLVCWLFLYFLYRKKTFLKV